MSKPDYTTSQINEALYNLSFRYDYKNSFEFMVANSKDGKVIDLDGGSFFVRGVVDIPWNGLRIQNGSILTPFDSRILNISGTDVILDNVRISRGQNVPGPGSYFGSSTVSVLADRFTSIDSDYMGGPLYFTSGNKGSKVDRGIFVNQNLSQDTSFIVTQPGGSSIEDLSINNITGGGGCAVGILLYDVLRARVTNNKISGVKRTPTVTLTGWTVSSGTIYKAPKSPWGATTYLIVDGLQKTYDYQNVDKLHPPADQWNQDNSFVYYNTTKDPNTSVITSTTTSGYGISVYTSGNVINDCVIAYNSLHDIESIGIYYQLGSNALLGKGNSTLHNTLTNVCTKGEPSGTLPYAGISVNGGSGTILNGDSINNSGAYGIRCVNGADGRASNVRVVTSSKAGLSVQANAPNFIVDPSCTAV